jgi:hypothetical protein
MRVSLATNGPMNRWVKVGGAVLLLAWAPFLYAELTSDPHEKEERAVADLEDPDPSTAVLLVTDAAAGKDETDEDKQAASRAAAEQAAKPNDEGVEPEAIEALAEPDNEPTGAAAQLAPLPKASGPVTELKIAFDSEPRDALWAKDAESKIAAVFTGEDIPETLLDKSACQKTVCRVDVTWSQENAAPYLDAVEELHRQFSTDYAVAPQAPADKEGEDALAVHVYVMRKGYTVADLSK